MAIQSDIDDGSPIDLHGKLAAIELVFGLLVAGMYYVFSQLGVMADFLWKLMLVVQVFVSAVLLFHYVINRRSRRLWVEGVVSMLALVPWLMIALIWLFYMLYIPVPVVLKASVVVICFGIIGRHAFMVLSDFRRAAKKEAVLSTIYRDDGNNFIFRSSRVGYIDQLTSRNPLKGSVLSVVGYLAPFAAAFGLSANHIFNDNVGPQVICIVLSLVAFPMSVSIIGNFYVKSLFFRVYLPLKLEKKTGKKVILGA
ncbi:MULTISPECIES: hypothetical protein [Burkholderia]|uniref:Uncharacterized protein n=1 Tax=Burkholderia pyrrocinia TaxID=60550 RepID=A0A318ICL9_BURPY|nr:MULTISPECIES: hypothetical protein [Burkholderia]PXX27590.1 hypothetical protein NA66_102036 [Burkholderia pyrrocinia]SFW81014.1 hypothetical protein SAMN03159384_05367 [Burkholderia sp. NFACC33-1]SFY43344.1 hypothetical protein SAMN03159408_05481 [Burkholderia sp. NFPP32]